MKKNAIKSEGQLSLLDVGFDDGVLSGHEEESSKSVLAEKESERLIKCNCKKERDSFGKRVAILVDGSNFVYRAFYALPQLTDPDGNPVGAVYGFCSMLISLFDKHKSDLFCVALDAGRDTFRKDIYFEYKSNREETPADLK